MMLFANNTSRAPSTYKPAASAYEHTERSTLFNAATQYLGWSNAGVLQYPALP